MHVGLDPRHSRTLAKMIQLRTVPNCIIQSRRAVARVKRVTCVPGAVSRA